MKIEQEEITVNKAEVNIEDKIFGVITNTDINLWIWFFVLA